MRRSLTERFYFTQYRGVRIYIADYSGLTDQAEGLDAFLYSCDLIQRQAKQSVYSFLDVSGSRFDIPLIQTIRKKLPQMKPYIAAQAYYGMRPVQRIVFNNITKLLDNPYLAVDDPMAGKDFLVQCYREHQKKPFTV